MGTIDTQLAGLRRVVQGGASVKALPAPEQPKTGPEVQREVQALLQEARNLFECMRDLPEARDAHDGLRVMAATCGVRIVVPKKSKVYVRPTLDMLRQIETLVGSVNSKVYKRLPERRDWIFQNAIELARSGLQQLSRVLMPADARLLYLPKPSQEENTR